jgi:hypothetical protein
MARRTSFKLPGFTTWVDNIKNEVSKNAAEEIVRDLQVAGPYWSGEFADAWVIKPGKTRVSATRGRSGPGRSTPASFNPKTVAAPAPSGRKSVNYTIGNEMAYRDIAMDLDPDRLRWKGSEPPNTAPDNWYLTYVEAGELRDTLKKATNRAAKSPKIRGFRGPNTSPS